MKKTAIAALIAFSLFAAGSASAQAVALNVFAGGGVLYGAGFTSGDLGTVNTNAEFGLGAAMPEGDAVLSARLSYFMTFGASGLFAAWIPTVGVFSGELYAHVGAGYAWRTDLADSPGYLLLRASLGLPISFGLDSGEGIAIIMALELSPYILIGPTVSANVGLMLVLDGYADM